MPAKYFQLPTDGPSDHNQRDHKQNCINGQIRSKAWSHFVIVFFVLLNICLWIYTTRKSARVSVPDNYAISPELSTTWAQFWWHTEYSPRDGNHSEYDNLWEQIKPSHGFIAINRQWAKEQHWPVSMYLPSDHTKGVYLLEAYHQLHCLRILRKTFWEAVEQRPYTYPISHSEHCFDALRQSVVCNADNTPLFTFGDFTAGNGQLHQCKNWDELRRFAEKNTACYRDSVERIPLRDHFGFCDNGDDGVYSLS